MTYTLSDCIESINQILNYPSVSYTDISVYFDQAIAELNTELHLGLRPISQIYKENSNIETTLSPLVVLNSRPSLSVNIPTVPSTTDKVYCSLGNLYYYNLSTSTYTKSNYVYGIYTAFDTDGTPIKEIYRTLVIGEYAYWTAYENHTERNVDLINYLPYEWIILFLIPYVCFKYAVRDGDTGASYAEDLSNGFQQLRNAYSVPNTVLLASVADKPAYKSDVSSNLPNLNIAIPTRAIYETMKVPSVIQASYDSIYSKGGWGF